jgi:quinol monooxygenase YgiN
MGMIIVSLRLKTAPEMRMNILRTIHSMLGSTSAQPGCLNCELFSNTQNDDKIFLLEIWDSKESLTKHLQSEEFRKVMSAMDSACEPPEVLFYETKSHEGMELIEKAISSK